VSKTKLNSLGYLVVRLHDPTVMTHYQHVKYRQTDNMPPVAL